MANVLNRTTKEFRASVNTPDFPESDWVINPDLSAVIGFPTKYWVITGNVVSLASQIQRDAIDDDEFEALIASSDGKRELFGDGSDGDFTVNGNQTMSRDMYAETVVINPGANVNTNGFRLLARKGIIIKGRVFNEGSNASGATAGTGAAPNSIGGGGAGAAGAVGVGATAADLTNDASPGIGSAGGSGGAGASGAGGNGGQTKPNAQLRVRPRRFDKIIEMADTDMGATGQRARFQGGAGGGAGAGSGSVAGGGGGGGGGLIVLVSPVIYLAPSGEISVKGGNGGNGAGNNAGGGGGGGGGVIAGVFQSSRQRGTITLSGGNGGSSGGGAGAAGQNGVAGSIIFVKVA